MNIAAGNRPDVSASSLLSDGHDSAGEPINAGSPALMNRPKQIDWPRALACQGSLASARLPERAAKERRKQSSARLEESEMMIDCATVSQIDRLLARGGQCERTCCV